MALTRPHRAYLPHYINTLHGLPSSTKTTSERPVFNNTCQSRMDPLSAFGLACNVIQVLSFGHEVLSTCKRVCCDGSPEPDLAFNAANLQNISKNLLDSLNSTRATDRFSKEQKDLRNVASKLIEVAGQLNKLVEEVTVDKGSSRRAAVASTMKYILRYKRKIQTLEKTLASFQNTLNSGILAHLCSTSEANALKSQHDLSKLNQSLRHFIEQCARGNQSVTNLISREVISIKEHVSAESEKTRSQTAANIQDLQLTTLTADRDKRFLDSLKYEQMNGRRSAITQSHEKTFKWILDESPSGPWDSLIQWLKSNDRTFYWISGKAGSGKSTLMKFIIGNDEIRKVLLERNTKITIASFFFWIAGTKMQRSIAGMLSSLLYQILRENKTILDQLLTKEPTLSAKESVFDWSIEELQRVILTVVSDRKFSHCLFIDGLDEVDNTEGQLELVRSLDILRCEPNVKLCVSSRPEPTLQKALASYPKLKLQDLTKDDIQRYANDGLSAIKLVGQGHGDDSKSHLVWEISRRADGVFLWVKLVVKSLQTGITNEDDWSTLEKRLDRLPRDLDQLYKHMWSRLNEDQELYRSEAAFYFKFVLFGRRNRPGRDLSLFELMIASEKSINNPGLDDDANEVIRLCEVVQNRMAARCAGLLEVNWLREDFSWDEKENNADSNLRYLKAVGGASITFIHRSARDFLLETRAGQEILSHCSKSDEDFWSDLIRANTARIQILISDGQIMKWHNSVLMMEPFVATKEILPKKTQFALLELYRRAFHKETKCTNDCILFLCLAVCHGLSTYVRYHVNQLETKYGTTIIEIKSRLLQSGLTSILPHLVTFYDPFFEKTVDAGRCEIISWLLINGADLNLVTTGLIADFDTPFATFLKSQFLGQTKFGHGTTHGLQKLLDFGDWGTRTLLYCSDLHSDLGSDEWRAYSRFNDDAYSESNRSFRLVVIEVNCLWLGQRIDWKLEANQQWNSKGILKSIHNNIAPEFKVLQIFYGNEHLTENQLKVLDEKVMALQDYLESHFSRTIKGGKLSEIVEDIYKNSSSMTEQENPRDWMIRKRYMAKQGSAERDFFFQE